jgi:hypothetical protein
MKLTARTARSAAVGLGSAAAFLAAITSAAIPADASANAARCRTGQLAIVLEHPVAQGGNQGWTIVAQDKGNTACTVSGYPKLGLRDSRGNLVRSVTSDGRTFFHGDPGASTVTLLPGGFARAFLSYGTVSGSGNVRAHELTVRVKGAARHKTGVLAAGSVTVTRGVLEVTAWQARKG